MLTSIPIVAIFLLKGMTGQGVSPQFPSLASAEVLLQLEAIPDVREGNGPLDQQLKADVERRYYRLATYSTPQIEAAVRAFIRPIFDQSHDGIYTGES